MAGKSAFTRRLLSGTVMLAAASPLMIGTAFAQKDPGLRQDPNTTIGITTSAGCFIPGLSPDESNFFYKGGGTFAEVDSVKDEGVSGAIDDASGTTGVPPGTGKGTFTLCPNQPGQVTGNRENDGGLGARFNADSCATCHAFPAVGGSSPPQNPQIELATRDGGNNTVPSFITATGPTREARFIHVPGTSTPDGGVHDLFTISGRADAQSPTVCNIAQPNFAQAVSQNNVIFRIPTPTFGAGLVENVTDTTLIADSNATANQAKALGIIFGFFNHVVQDDFNRSGNDGTITRFGWKAQNKSLLIFAGEAYNVEQGISNEAFPNEREDDANCQFKAVPNDTTELVNEANSNSPAGNFSSDVVQFGGFMRLSAAPTAASTGYSTTAGNSVSAASIARGFTAGFDPQKGVGCNVCHIPSHKLTASAFTNLQNQTFAPFSDFSLHGMGTGLQDQVSQGAANGQQFRSAPLWGVGQRIFFLHDGRTSDLLTAIEDHKSNGSEANAVINAFNSLSAGSKQDILNFLRSL